MTNEAITAESVQQVRYAALDTTNRVAIKNILFATDLSPAAGKALPYSIELARRYQAKIYAVHVIGPEVYVYAPAAAWPKLAEEEELGRAEAKRQLGLELGDVPHELIFRPGGIWETLNDVIRTKRIDLLVIGTHGRTGIEKVLMGSVASKVFRQALCPVLTVGPNVNANLRPTAELNRILYATDFSPESLAAAPYAISLAREHRAQLILLNCFEDGGDVQAMLHTLRDLVPFGAELRSTPDCIVERGPHAQKILTVAEGHGADQIVLGVNSNGKHVTTTGHLERSALYEIVTRAACPVLTVRAS